MPDPLFADPRLARIYDVFDGPRDDLDAYLAIAAELGAHRIADLGCGTGSLAVLLAAKGYAVTGADPAAASLDVARGKPGADAATWVHGTARDLPAGFDLAMMTGNVAQVFLADDAWHDTLEVLHDRLRAHGHLVFETRRPSARAWEDWEHQTTTTRDVPGLGRVEQRFTLIEVALPLVRFRLRYRFPDGITLTSDSTLRFRSREEVTADLAAAGFETPEVRQAPDRPGREHVFLARRRG